jgi:hypothetical protein
MTIALFDMLSGVHSVWCFSRYDQHIDIDAASFGIIERSEAGILRLGMFTLFRRSLLNSRFYDLLLRVLHASWA